MKTKKTRKPGKKPAKRTNAKSRPAAKKTRKNTKVSKRPRTGRAGGIVQGARSLRDQLVRKYVEARERLARFYKRNKMPIDAAGVGALTGLGLGALQYGIGHLNNVAQQNAARTSLRELRTAADESHERAGTRIRDDYDPNLGPLWNDYLSSTRR